MRIKSFIRVCLFFCFGLAALRSQACTPLAVPNLLNQSISGPNLLLDWQSVNMWICNGYSVQVEIVPLNSSFTGANLFVSSVLNKTVDPQAFPQQTINLGVFCPTLTVYKFRAREIDGTLVSGWTQDFTFTITPVTPTLNLSPSTTSAGVICTIGYTQLNLTVSQSSGPAAYSYTWLPATDLSCYNCPNPVATAGSGNTYTCTVSNGCWTLTKTLTTHPPPSMSSDPAVLCLGESATLSIWGADTFTWNTGVTGPTLHLVAPGASTVYYVTGITAGCFVHKAYYVVVNICTALESIAFPDDLLQSYPNPVAGSEALLLSASQPLQLDLFNSQGQHLYTIALNEERRFRYKLSLPASGIYFLRGVHEGRVFNRRIVALD